MNKNPWVFTADVIVSFMVLHASSPSSSSSLEMLSVERLDNLQNIYLHVSELMGHSMSIAFKFWY